MRRFLTGLLLGIAVMYWYAYQKDSFVQEVKAWLAEASNDPDATAKVDKVFSRKQ